MADRAHGDAARRRLELHLRHRGHHVGELRAAERSVQHRDVVGIDHVLEMLQPVAGNDRRAAAADRGIVGLDELAVVHLFQAFVARQHRLFLGRSHIGEDQPVALLQRDTRAGAPCPEQAALGLAGLFEAVALGVELPAVIAAADAVFLDLAVIERGAAMAAARVQQADAGACLSRNRTRSSPSTRTLLRRYRWRRRRGRRGASSAAAVRPSACRGRPRSVRSGWWTASWHSRSRDRDPAG